MSLAIAIGARAQAKRVECAWCRDVLSEGAEPVSHGICRGCAKRVLREELGLSEAEAEARIEAEFSQRKTL